MSDVINRLKASTDPLDNDLAQILEHWQEAKRERGEFAGLGYEPRDIKAQGAIPVISSRVLNASAGFEEIHPDQSYEALVLRYPERFSDDVIAAAKQRLKLGTSKIDQFRRQDIQFLIKSSGAELFGEDSREPSRENWVGRTADLPGLGKEDSHAEEFLAKGFRAFLWLHEKDRSGASGKGLTAIATFGPLSTDKRARLLDIDVFAKPVGKELLEAHKGDGSVISKMGAYRHNRIWPISTDEVDLLLSAAIEKARRFTAYETPAPDPRNPLNLETIEETMTLREVVLRRQQALFRKELLKRGPQHCAITGTTELSVLEAAHIIPYALKFADRDKPQNGLLLRSDIHKLFDKHLISINPQTRAVEISDSIVSADYQALHGKIVPNEISAKSLDFHFEQFRKRAPIED